MTHACALIMGSATGKQAVVNVGAQLGQRHLSKTRQQHLLGILECVIQRCIDGGFNQASGGFQCDSRVQAVVAHLRHINVVERDVLKSHDSRQPPPCPFSDWTNP